MNEETQAGIAGAGDLLSRIRLAAKILRGEAVVYRVKISEDPDTGGVMVRSGDRPLTLNHCTIDFPAGISIGK